MAASKGFSKACDGTGITTESAEFHNCQRSALAYERTALDREEARRTWCARRDSNSRPIAPEAIALSS